MKEKHEQYYQKNKQAKKNCCSTEKIGLLKDSTV